MFCGKAGFMTLRDLFRWAERYRLADEPGSTFFDWDQLLADEGIVHWKFGHRSIRVIKKWKARNSQKIKVIFTECN